MGRGGGALEERFVCRVDPNLESFFLDRAHVLTLAVQRGLSSHPNQGRKHRIPAAGRRRPPSFAGDHARLPSRPTACSKGEQYPADPPTVEEIVAVMRIVGDRADGQRLRALIVLLCRAGVRISEALALRESDLDSARGSILIRRGKGGKRREVGMDP